MDAYISPQYSGQGSERLQMGMAQQSPYAWSPPAMVPNNGRAIDFLRPRSPQHAFVLQYLLRRLNWSETKMSQFYPRWQANELRLQAYVTLPQYEEIVRKIREDGRVEAPESVVVPYAWATMQTIVTYMLHTFGGRRPIFAVGSYRAEQVHRAPSIETLLQYNADRIRYIKHLYDYFSNGEAYGVAIQRNNWTREERTRITTRAPDALLGQLMSMQGRSQQPVRVSERVVSFEGNGVSVINPYMFFPDPRVPMVDVATKGEFCFWRDFQGKHMLLRAQAQGSLKWVEAAETTAAVGSWPSLGGDSLAGLRALGDPLTSGGLQRDYAVAPNIQVDQGTVEIIPKELGLGPSTTPEKWLFTILNKSQIVQAEPFICYHGEHPVSVTEPNAFGHSFGQLSTVDNIAPMQDLMTWLLNSHMYNVRASLNNIMVVDPQRVEIDDLLNPLPGGIIRLKSTPWAPADARTAIQQLQVQDITRANISDFGLVQRLANDLTGVNDNIRGQQDSGGRKTATEVRTSFEAAGSRLASRAMLYSAMGLSRGAQQWAMNFQQFLTEPMEIALLGENGVRNSVRITPESIEGDFYFPIHDGTLPLDKIAQLDIWREVWQGIVSDPTGQMQQTYNAPGIFRFMAQLGGAQNIDEFLRTPQGPAGGAQMVAASPEAIGPNAQAGNLVPLSAVPGMNPGLPQIPMIGGEA